MKIQTMYEGEQEFLTLLGYAITSWQLVEEASFHLYCSASELKNDIDIASTTWHHLTSFDNRLALLSTLSQLASFKLSEIDEFPDLLKKIRAASETRNAIIHGVFTALPLGNSYISPYLGDFSALAKGRHEKAKFKFDGHRLQEEAEVFRTLSANIFAFIQANF